MSRQLVFPLLASALALLVALTLGELLVRLIPAATYRATPAGERWDWVGPGDRRSRAAPVVSPGSPGDYRLVTVGDSFTWGAGVYPEDTWPARLARRLGGERTDLEINLFNLSRPGWNTHQQQWWFRREFEKLAPDLVVLGFCLNDAEPLEGEELAALRRILGDLATGVASGDLEPRGPSALLNRIRLSWRNLDSRRRVTTYHHSLYGDQPGWAAARRALENFGRLSRERAFPLLMVIFPVFDSQFDDRYPYRELHRAVGEAGREAGLTVLDLLPFYEGIDARRLAVTPFTDPHPNELAHRIAADAIAEHLIGQRLVPAR